MAQGIPNNKIKVARLADGVAVPFEMPASGNRANTGRHRWIPGGEAIAFEVENEKSEAGIRIASFPAGKEPVSNRTVTGFQPGPVLESFGVAPDGNRFVGAEFQHFANILLVEGVDGVVSPNADAAGGSGK
ncbi:MAG: hypothetical protein ABIT01_03910 [Thermoanaerobaculia bacterium]